MNSGTQENNGIIPSNKFLNSATNDWIICNSSSRPGQKYYFNKKTRESVWNLSDVEIIHARDHSEELNSVFGNIPEPKGPPTMDPSQNVPGINNQMINVWSTPPLPNIAQAPQYFIIAPMVNPAAQQINQNPMLALQNVAAIQSAALNMNHSQMFAFQNTYPPLNQNRPNNNNNSYCNRTRRRSFSRNVNNDQSNREFKTDLRQKLTRKRRYSFSSGQGEIQNNHRSYSATNKSAADSEEETEKNSGHNLADLLNSENCCIVFDTDVILNDFTFIDNLIVDNSFRIVVPHHVMEELKEHACRNGEAPVRRIVRFLSEKIRSQLVTLGEEVDQRMVPSNQDKIFITCSLLAEDNNNIILVSNNSDIQKYKTHNEHIQIVTISKFKDMISKIKVRAPRFASPTRAIKIIVPNDRATTVSNNNETEINITNDLNSPSKDSSSIRSNQSVDFEVQKDIEENHTNETTNTHSNDTFDEIDSRSSSNIENNISQSYGVKRREIKLNRSNIVTKVKTEESDSKEPKKQFRWSRRKSKIGNKSQHTQTCNVAIETDLVDLNDINQTQMSTESQSENPPISTPNKMTPQSDRQSNASVNKFNNLPEISNNQVAFNNTDSQFDESPVLSPVVNLGTNLNKFNVLPQISNTHVVSSNTDGQLGEGPAFPSVVNLETKIKDMTLRQCHMFEILNQRMEDALRTRCDEWISRFVQIMEEILREKLQEDPPFESKDFPPPWNLHEAAKCIIKKFSDYFHIVDAANKLSFVLYKLSDDKGKIKMSIQPAEYMEMYSYGVYLIENFRDISVNEELETASECLNKLLYDIHNANIDTSFNDIFGDDLQESAVERSAVTEEPEPEPQSSNASNSSILNKNNAKSNASPRIPVEVTSYNLRSTTKKPEIEVQSPIKSPVNKSSFMSTLRLTSSPRTPSSVESSYISSSSRATQSILSSITRTICNSPRSINKTPIQSPKLTSPQKQTGDQTNDIYNNRNTDNAVKENTAPSTVSSKCIRIFQVCPEFEERLNRARHILELDDHTEDSDVDYSGMPMNDFRYFPSNVNNILSKTTVDEGNAKEALSKNNQTTTVNEETTNEALSEEIQVDNCNNYEKLMRCFLGDLKNTFANVNLLCYELIKNRKTSNSSIKTQLSLKADEAIKTMEQTNNLLYSYLNRDTNSETSFVTLLKDAKIESVSDEMYSKYRCAVTLLKDQSDKLISLLKLFSTT